MRTWWSGAARCGAALLAARIVTAAPERPDALRFTLVAPPSARRGEPIPITLRLLNAGSRPLDLYLAGRTITFDIIVARVHGQVVWRRLEGASGEQILQIKTLAPGEHFELQDVWKQRTNAGVPVAPGDYTLQGVLPTDAAPLRTALVRLRITPA